MVGVLTFESCETELCNTIRLAFDISAISHNSPNIQPRFYILHQLTSGGHKPKPQSFWLRKELYHQTNTYSFSCSECSGSTPSVFTSLIWLAKFIASWSLSMPSWLWNWTKEVRSKYRINSSEISGIYKRLMIGYMHSTKNALKGRHFYVTQIQKHTFSTSVALIFKLNK